jgi:beta-galactosidase beta subunit
MILDNNIKTIGSHFSNPMIGQSIIQFIEKGFDKTAYKHGDKIELNDDVSVVILFCDTAFDKLDILEAHKKNLDVHYTLSGIDKMAAKNIADCTHIEKKYDADNDYLLIKELPTEVCEIPVGSYAILPPSLAHMALYQTKGRIEKLVFKVKV